MYILVDHSFCFQFNILPFKYLPVIVYLIKKSTDPGSYDQDTAEEEKKQYIRDPAVELCISFQMTPSYWTLRKRSKTLHVPAELLNSGNESTAYWLQFDLATISHYSNIPPTFFKGVLIPLMKVKGGGGVAGTTAIIKASHSKAY